MRRIVMAIMLFLGLLVYIPMWHACGMDYNKKKAYILQTGLNLLTTMLLITLPKKLSVIIYAAVWAYIMCANLILSGSEE